MSDGPMTVLRNTGKVLEALLTEMRRRGGRVHVGDRRKPGNDRDIYAVVAQTLGVTDKELQLNIEDIDQSVTENDVNRYGRNAWDYTMLVAVQHGRQRGRIAPSQVKGIWELPQSTSDEMEVVEGRRLLKVHKLKERKPQIVRHKKRAVLEAKGRLSCEACDFDFAEVYGEFGEGFAECHHRLPLAELDGEVPTRLRDLAIVCSNCHRILHLSARRSGQMMRVEDLRSLILQRRSSGRHA